MLQMFFLLFQISLFNQSLMETITETSFFSTLYIIHALYGTINLQMPCKSGEIKIGNAVNYFSLTFISQDKLLVDDDH